MPAPLAALFIALLGAIVGSFLATVIMRGSNAKGLIGGRSRCDSCGAALQAIDLVPLLSAMVQRGRCRYCNAPIAPLHWRVEAGAAAIGAVCGLMFPLAQALSLALAVWLLLALAICDSRAQWLPDLLTVPLAIFGLLLGGVAIGATFESRAVGGAVGFGSLALIRLTYRQWRGREGLGGGDPKLFGALGAWLGIYLLPFVLLVAALAGIAYALVAGKRGNDAVPFGVFLAIAAMLVGAMQLGDALVYWPAL